LNWLLIFKNSSDRLSELTLINPTTLLGEAPA